MRKSKLRFIIGSFNKERELELAFLKKKQEFQAGHAKKREKQVNYQI